VATIRFPFPDLNFRATADLIPKAHSVAAANCEAAVAFDVPALQRAGLRRFTDRSRAYMISLAQERLIFDPFIFLKKEIFTKSDGLSQLELGLPISFQFAIIACCCAARSICLAQPKPSLRCENYTACPVLSAVPLCAVRT